MRKKLIACLFFSITVVACASQSPVIDTKGVDMSNYKIELGECQEYADQISMGTETAIGAGIGAALGWAVSAAAGRSYDNDASAAVGAVTGGGSGMGDAAKSAATIIKNCLRGRGYRVLN